jgi:hypothetical protein
MDFYCQSIYSMLGDYNAIGIDIDRNYNNNKFKK